MAGRLRIAALAVAATTMSMPAVAGEPQPGIGVAVQWSGHVIVEVSAVPGYSLAGICSFAGSLLPNNTMTVGYGGVATSTAVTAAPRIPSQVIIGCQIYNEVGNIDSFRWTTGGAASELAATVVGWPLSPITICIQVQAFYGPTDQVFLDSGLRCVAPVW